jgi:hypothetical protein
VKTECWEIKDVTDKRDPLDAYIDSAAALLGLPLDPAWKGPIRANLEFTLNRAAFVGEKELPDDAEPAAIYQA